MIRALHTRPARLLPLLAISASIASCSNSEESDSAGAPSSNPPLSAECVILITLDTVRADHLSLHGYELPTTPHLESLGRQATVYTRARAAAPWTLPSHATLFTGLYPFEHGARTYDQAEVRANNVGELADEFLTLAEAFKRHGYRTGAVVANGAYLRPRFQLDQGFDEYQVERAYADEINRLAFAWLEQNGEQPFFLFLNYMDAHGPYNCAPSEGFPDLGEVTPSNQLLRALHPVVCGEDEPLPTDSLDHLIAQYDNALANLDIGLGQLFEKLRELELFDKALIVITSDHGEYFGEHRLLAHSKDVYEEAMHIPLVVKAPRQTAGRVDDGLVSHVHIPGLILSHVDFDALSQVEQDTFQRHWPRAALLGENYYSRAHDLREEWGQRFRRVRRTVYHEDYKYIESSDGNHELYDLRADPRESINLFEVGPGTARTFAKLLESIGEANPAGESSRNELILSPEDLEALDALGY